MDPGFHFTLNMYDPAGTTPEGTYDTVVPNMTFSSFTAASKTLKGKGPASTALTAELWHYNLDSGGGSTSTTKTVTSASNGSWSVNFAPAAIRGNDYAYVDWSDGGYFNYDYYAYVPALYCREGYNECEVYGLPGKKASISVKHGKLSAKISGTINPLGDFWGYLYDKYGRPLFPTAGDKVKASGVKTYVLPSLTSLPDYTNDAVIGSAPPTPGSRWGWKFMTTHLINGITPPIGSVRTRPATTVRISRAALISCPATGSKPACGITTPSRGTKPTTPRMSNHKSMNSGGG